jgi:tetratricopeptide (TPR) repeat protein
VVLDIKVNSISAKIVVTSAALLLCAALAVLAITGVIAGLLTDQRTRVGKELLSKGVKYAPYSAPLRARLAEAEMLSEERDLSVAESQARLAITFAPWDYNHRMLLAGIEEAKGDRASAEDALLDALKLAPNYTVVHWRLANVLLRQGKLGKSLSEFRAANNFSNALLPSSLDLVWKVSSGNLAAVQAITPDEARAKIVLVQFLIQQSRAAEAAGIFSSIDPDARLAQPETSGIISALISGGHFELARFLWADTISHGSAKRDQALGSIWNGDFESDIRDKFAHFDWTIGQSAYARANVSRETAHSGARSLRIDFTGRDTTRLDDEVSQRFLVRGGARYKLDFFVKTDGLVTPEGPRIVVADSKSSPAIAASEPAPAGSNDWRHASVEFVAPSTASSLVLAIRRIPKFSYDNPTSGTIWFDDFSLIEQGKAR